ncbi:MAG: dephospho-CoA kinase, partial [Saccharolobus sp.]
ERMRSDDAKDISDLIKRDKEELSLGIGNVIAMADYVIVNDSSYDEFKRKCNQIIDKVLSND